ncbi:hypothetical protein KIN20_033620 [Parelaphostrongylus tenuis]|uniref:Uncharacterized protein n=1 Tax=Parelaphostrongylus tenuis TaxID=148309 RepID=A0AAD5R8D5_PARTN|nr:hypothetical protein KIN20_033620 [Parelaphostrongylus tenuis]
MDRENRLFLLQYKALRSFVQLALRNLATPDTKIELQALVFSCNPKYSKKEQFPWIENLVRLPFSPNNITTMKMGDEKIPAPPRSSAAPSALKKIRNRVNVTEKDDIRKEIVKYTHQANRTIVAKISSVTFLMHDDCARLPSLVWDFFLLKVICHMCYKKINLPLPSLRLQLVRGSGNAA